MKDTISVKDAAIRWNLATRTVAGFCRSGRIPGAEKSGRDWKIPTDAEKPVDHRIKTGVYIKSKGHRKHLPFPVGVSDYRLASTEYYYIDKTMMLRDFLDERPAVTLFTRPRRFGKTLNMDMFRTFFEKTDEDTSVYFVNRKIWRQGEYYRSFQGKYPVVFLSFKDVKKSTWAETYSNIKMQIVQEFIRHKELESSENITDRQYYAAVINGELPQSDFEESLKMLTMMLNQHYGIPAVVIIDEYDTPIQSGHINGFYNEVIAFMRNLLSGGLKDNRNLAFGFLTGILRVAKESIFSGLNNLKINSVLDSRYSEYFGFTVEDVHEIAAYYGVSDKYEEICDWYDGYRFGRTEIFNPWSVINYFSNDCEPRTYWLSTGSNEIIGEILKEADRDIISNLTTLVNGNSFTTYIDTGVIYPQIRNNPSSIYSFLLVAGYLKVIKSSVSLSGNLMCEVAVPNREIALVYRKEILQHLESFIPQSSTIAVEEALYNGNAKKLRDVIGTLLLQSVSFFDVTGENFYHGFMLGICALFGGSYVTSNRESGEGRYDICLEPRSNTVPGIIIELKADKNCDETALHELAEKALQQIHEKKYDSEMKTKGIAAIFKYGIAFSGKKVEIAVG